MKAPGRIWLNPNACPVLVCNDTLSIHNVDSDDVVIKEEKPEVCFSATSLSNIKVEVENDFEEFECETNAEPCKNDEIMPNCMDFLVKTEENWDKFQIAQAKIIRLANEGKCQEAIMKKTAKNSYNSIKEVLNEELIRQNSDDSILKMYKELSLLKDKMDESKVPKNVVDYLLKKIPNTEINGQSLEDNVLLQYVNINEVNKLSHMIQKMKKTKRNIDMVYEVIEEQLTDLTLGEMRKHVMNEVTILIKEGNMHNGINLLKHELALLRGKKTNEIVKLVSIQKFKGQAGWDNWIEKYWIMFKSIEENLSNLLIKVDKNDKLKKNIDTAYKKLVKKLYEIIPSFQDQIDLTCDDVTSKKRIHAVANKAHESEQNISNEEFICSENQEERLPIKKMKSSEIIPKKLVTIVNEESTMVDKEDLILFSGEQKNMIPQIKIDLNDDEVNEGYEEPELMLNQPSNDCILTINEFETFNTGNPDS